MTEEWNVCKILPHYTAWRYRKEWRCENVKSQIKMKMLRRSLSLLIKDVPTANRERYHEWWTGKDKEENGSDLLTVASQVLLQEWEKLSEEPGSEPRTESWGAHPHHGLDFNDFLLILKWNYLTATEVIQTRLNNSYSAARYELQSTAKLKNQITYTTTTHQI